MPTSPTLPLPASAPPADRSTTQSVAQAKSDNDGFHKALGHARNGATQGHTTGPEHEHAHANRPDDTHRSRHDKHEHDGTSDHAAPASTIAAFTPGLELRPVIAAGTGKTLPVKLATGARQVTGPGKQDSVQSLLSQLQGAAQGKPSNPFGALATTAEHGANPRADKTLVTLEALAESGLQGQDSGKKDLAAGTVDLGRTSLGALNLQPVPTTAQPAVAHQLQIPCAPTSPQFTQSLSQHVAWLGSQDIKQAVIHLHPRDLGPINVNVQVTHNQVDVSFAVQHPATVHALQQTLPQLDTLLAQQGLNLGQAQVDQQHNPQQQQASHGENGSGHSAPGDAGADAAIDAPAPTRQLAIGLVDDFA